MLNRSFMIICSISPSVQYNKQDRTLEMKSQPPSLPFQHKFFHEIRTSTVYKQGRLVEIGQPQIWKPMKLSQLEKRIQQTLPNSKDITQKWPKPLAPKWPGQVNARPSNEAWALCKSNPSRVSWGSLSTCPKLAPSLDTLSLEGY